jgi:hypothetical protein
MRAAWLISGVAACVVACGAAAYLLGYVPDSWPSVKGIHLGMTESELAAILPQKRRLTIAGVHDAAAAPEFKFEEGKLAGFKFKIPEGSYAPVRDAVTAKYPQMRCRLMMINIPGHVQMPHEECQWGSLLVVQSIFGQDVDPDRVMLTHAPSAETQGWIQDREKKDV